MSALSPPLRGRGDPLAQDGARLALALGIAEGGGDVPDERGVLLANLHFHAHEALPLTALAPTG